MSKTTSFTSKRHFDEVLSWADSEIIGAQEKIRDLKKARSLTKKAKRLFEKAGNAYRDASALLDTHYSDEKTEAAASSLPRQSSDWLMDIFADPELTE